MDKEGIGTDATIASHIKKIQDRSYSSKVRYQLLCLDRSALRLFDYHGPLVGGSIFRAHGIWVGVD